MHPSPPDPILATYHQAVADAEVFAALGLVAKGFLLLLNGRRHAEAAREQGSHGARS
jgi:hypothetical protein